MDADGEAKGKPAQPGGGLTGSAGVHTHPGLLLPHLLGAGDEFQK